MSTHAAFWDNPDAQDNTPVIRHAPDAHNYHLPDYDQLSKMRGSKVGKFAIIPAANKDGTSKAFDPTVAGPVHVDPDAPDGGVIFDPNEVRKQDLNRAVNQSTYAHQAFYQLGTPAPLLGIGRNKMAAFAGHHQNAFDVDRGPNPHMPNTYVTPRAAELPAPAFVANGYGGGPASHNPLYRAQEEQALNPVPPLNSLPPLGPAPVAGPAPLPAPQQPQYPQPQQAYQPPPGQPGGPPPGYYAPPQAYAPPPMDPNLHAMMQGMVSMQQQIAALTGQLAQRPPLMPPTTGMSDNPLPKGRPVALSTQPVEETRGRRYQGQPVDDDEYNEESARPIRKQAVKGRPVEEDDEDEVKHEARDRSLVRRSRRDEDDEPRGQTIREVERHNAEPEGVIYGFESLELPFVDGPIGRKAKKRVVLEIPGAGNHMAQFHDVIVSKECVVLVYDTRYTEGTQYMPPELGETVITVRVLGKDKNGKDSKSYRVCSMGFNYSFGVFDHIVLVKQDEEPVDYDEEK